MHLSYHILGAKPWTCSVVKHTGIKHYSIKLHKNCKVKSFTIKINIKMKRQMKISNPNDHTTQCLEYRKMDWCSPQLLVTPSSQKTSPQRKCDSQGAKKQGDSQKVTLRLLNKWHIYMESVPSYRFCRCHRTHWINKWWSGIIISDYKIMW